jgi:NAD(P)-dependent dehydrogenase (short-subunit alcohol dehydrogenase family)
VLPGRSEAANAALAAEFGSERTWVAQVDFSREDSLIRLREDSVARFGTIDHVVAPLGAWWNKGPSLDQPLSELRELLSTYVESPWLLLKTMAPALRTSHGSYTFITGSAGEATHIPGAGLLVAAVGAQLALARMLRHELSAEPFRVNEVRIATRIEREPRPGVVPSRIAGAIFVEFLTSEARGALFHYSADRKLVEVKKLRSDVDD